MSLSDPKPPICSPYGSVVQFLSVSEQMCGNRQGSVAGKHNDCTIAFPALADDRARAL